MQFVRDLAQRQSKNMSWRIADIKDGKTYVLALCSYQDGTRYFQMIESGSPRPGNAFALTLPVPAWMLHKRSLRIISESVSLESGRSILR